MDNAQHREQLVPGYETDVSAVGDFRTVQPHLLENEQHWSELHPELAKVVTE